MFYSHQILAKKGPLGTIWIAAHMDRKLRRNQIADTCIGDSVDSILQPQVPLALRLSGQLLLGVVRIYSRQVNYLFSDCTDTLLKFKQLSKPSANCNSTTSTASVAAVTLPEQHEQLELTLTPLPPSTSIMGGAGDAHLAACAADITLQEEDDVHGGVAFSMNHEEELIDMDDFDQAELAAATSGGGGGGGGSTLLADDATAGGGGGDGGDGGVEPEEPTLQLMDMDEMLEADAAEAAARGHQAAAPAAAAEQQQQDAQAGGNEHLDLEVERFRDGTVMGDAGIAPTALATPAGDGQFEAEQYDAGWTPGVTPAAAPLSELQLALGTTTPRPSTRKDSLLATPALSASLGLPSPASHGGGDGSGLAGITVRGLNATATDSGNIDKASLVRREAVGSKKRKLAVEAAVMLSNEQMRQQLKSTAALLRTRQPKLTASPSCLGNAQPADSMCVVTYGYKPCARLASLYTHTADCSMPPPPPPCWSASLPAAASSATSSAAAAAAAPSEPRPAADAAEWEAAGGDTTTAAAGSPQQFAQLPQLTAEAETELELPMAEEEPFMDDGGDMSMGMPTPLSCGSNRKRAAPESECYDDAPTAGGSCSGVMMNSGGARVEWQTLSAASLAAREAQLNTGRMSLATALHVGDPTTAPDDDEAAVAAAELHEQGRTDGVWSERTKGVLDYLQTRFKEKQAAGGHAHTLGAYELLHGQTPREAARFFFECLLLNNKGFVTLAQAQPYAEVHVTSTGKRSVR